MPELVARISEQWAVIESAPIPFAAALIVLAGLIWTIVSWSYRSTVSSKDAEIALLVRQRDDYKDKLGGASPDEARARIDRLETQIGAFAPRRLTDDQRMRFAAILKRLSGTVDIAFDISAADARLLARDFVAAFDSAGWQTLIRGVTVRTLYPVMGGIELTVLDPELPNPQQRLIAEGLDVSVSG